MKDMPMEAHCRECGATFLKGGLLADSDELIKITNERGGYYCEEHRKK